ncbi:MAG: phosphoenolpyruvate synthase [Candidatus Chisholmbacteria bacterium]|nr:phosphoenolpyruvate synthase [Candidatus Chisholmbacteria bacterium]
MSLPYVVWFKDVDKSDIALVGGKGANLGEMTRAGFPVPNGFIVTSAAYSYILESNYLRSKIYDLLSNLDVNKPQELDRVSHQIRQIIIRADVPSDLSQLILKAYAKLSPRWSDALVAVRSSATAEDLPDASFAGQQETYLNVKGDANLIQNIRHAWASLFTPRAIFYRTQKKFDHLKVGIAVPIQTMIQSEVSGVMFTVDPVTNDKTTLVIEAIWGLGELIVQGSVTPDHYKIRKSGLSLVHKVAVPQEKQLIRKGNTNQIVPVPRSRQTLPKLSDTQIRQLAELGLKLHQHYFFPQDIEWALENKQLYILQTRPITTIEKATSKTSNQKSVLTITSAISKLPILLTGDPASPGIATGPIRVIPSPRQIHQLKPRDILVTDMTSPDFVPAMRQAAAVVTNQGGQTSHAAIVSRELGIPCIVGTKTATQVLKPNMVITINGSTGEIYQGTPPQQIIKLIAEHPLIATPESLNLKTATHLYVNLAEPSKAAEIAKLNVDGVGLLRAEFMIADIGIHPKKLIHDGKKSVFIHQLAKGLETFCAAFNPRPVVYRATDFKTNEYSHLTGGKTYEPQESNPMLGYRGAFRYIADPQVFDLELEAIKKVRNQAGYKNLWLMIPFVHTPQELHLVKKLVTTAGLIRSPSFKLWMMVEIPSNIILLEDFIKIGIDGISIGTNDLTMLTLGVDRDNSEVASAFDDTHPAVLSLMQTTITTAKKFSVTTSVCGQAPSDHPDLVHQLISWGVTSISVNPDALGRTREYIHSSEHRLVSKI